MAHKRRRGKFVEFTQGPNQGKQAIMYYDEQNPDIYQKEGKVLVHIVGEDFEPQPSGNVKADAKNLKVIGFFD